MLSRLFAATGMAAADAAYCADALVQTNLWGIDSHGVLRAPIYLTRLRNGAVNAEPDIQLHRGRRGLRDPRRRRRHGVRRRP